MAGKFSVGNFLKSPKSGSKHAVFIINTLYLKAAGQREKSGRKNVKKKDDPHFFLGTPSRQPARPSKEGAMALRLPGGLVVLALLLATTTPVIQP